MCDMFLILKPHNLQAMQMITCHYWLKITDVLKVNTEKSEMLNTDKCNLLLNSQKPNALKIGIYT